MEKYTLMHDEKDGYVKIEVIHANESETTTVFSLSVKKETLVFFANIIKDLRPYGSSASNESSPFDSLGSFF